MNFQQDPDEKLDYTINWARVLVPGETIASSVWYDDGGGVVGTGDYVPPAPSATSATVWVVNPTRGVRHKVTNRITTSAVPPRVFQRSIFVSGIDR